MRRRRWEYKNVYSLMGGYIGHGPGQVADEIGKLIFFVAAGRAR